jgi:hypothetical protein
MSADKQPKTPKPDPKATGQTPKQTPRPKPDTLRSVLGGGGRRGTKT